MLPYQIPSAGYILDKVSLAEKPTVRFQQGCKRKEVELAIRAHDDGPGLRGQQFGDGLKQLIVEFAKQAALSGATQHSLMPPQLCVDLRCGTNGNPRRLSATMAMQGHGRWWNHHHYVPGLPRSAPKIVPVENPLQQDGVPRNG